MFLSQYADYVILIHAFSFLTMSLAIVGQRRKAANSDLLDSFFMLALFGLFRFLSELMPLLWSLLDLPRTYMTTFSYIRVGLIILSFQFLLYFGFMILTEPERRIRWFVYLSPLVIGVHYLIGINLDFIAVGSSNVLKLLLAFPSSVLATAAFLGLTQKVKSLHLRRLVWDLRILAVTFFVYGLSIIPWAFKAVEPTSYAMLVVVLRTVPIAVITIFVFRILSIFELEPQKSEFSPQSFSSNPNSGTR